MKITVSQVKRKFDDLISGVESEKEIADWSTSIRSSDDFIPLTYHPEDLSQIIWNALVYPEGVDIKLSPNVYLYNSDDFKRMRGLLKLN